MHAFSGEIRDSEVVPLDNGRGKRDGEDGPSGGFAYPEVGRCCAEVGKGCASQCREEEGGASAPRV